MDQSRASRRHHVTTPDGRVLAVTDGGDPTGTAVFVHLGTPCGGVFDPDWVTSAGNSGLRLVTWDRPGYGDSARHPGRSVSSVAPDAVTVADALGIGSFVTWGMSGGGPHALACAALLPERVRAVAVLAGVGPYGAPGLDWLAGMGQDNIEEFGAAVAGEPELRRYLDAARAGMVEALAHDPQAVVGEMASLLPPVDADYLRSHPVMMEMFEVALRPGYEGWLDDDLAFARSWGFELADVGVRTLVLQGNQDLMVPAAHGHYLAATIPGAELRVLPDDGHLTLLDHLDEVHAWLLAP